MSRREIEATQDQLRRATKAYLLALPAMHREAILLMASDRSKPPHAVIAGAIEREIAEWRAGMLEGQGSEVGGF